MRKFEVQVPNQYVTNIEADSINVRDNGSIIFCKNTDDWPDEFRIVAVYPSDCIVIEVEPK